MGYKVTNQIGLINKLEEIKAGTATVSNLFGHDCQLLQHDIQSSNEQSKGNKEGFKDYFGPASKTDKIKTFGMDNWESNSSQNGNITNQIKNIGDAKQKNVPEIGQRMGTSLYRSVCNKTKSINQQVFQLASGT